MRTELKHGSSSGDEDTAAFQIETLQDYEMATRRVATLSSGPQDASTEREQKALLAAIKAWDTRHDDASSWKE